VIEGNVRRAGNQVRITVQLIDAANGEGVGLLEKGVGMHPA
jgi:TolB-like protein